jgi:hypothetical protein
MKQSKGRPCDEWAERLAAHHPDDLAPDVRAALNTHLKECESCRAVYFGYQHVAQLVEQLPDFSLPAGLPPKLLEEWGKPDEDEESIGAQKDSKPQRQIRRRWETAGELLHLVIEIGPGAEGAYPVTLHAGEDTARGIFQMPAADAPGMPPLPDWNWLAAQEPEPIQHFGQRLFAALFQESISAFYTEGLELAARQQIPLRLSLSLQAPELERVPWEALYDPHLATYLSLAPEIELVRIVVAPARPARPLARMQPLRILGITPSLKSHQGEDGLRSKDQHQQAPKALAGLQAYGLIEWQEVTPASWQEALEVLQADSWHSIHIAAQISPVPEGEDATLSLGETGAPVQQIRASHLAQRLAGHPSLQVVVLTPSAGPSVPQPDGFAKAAASLVRQGVPSVLSIPTHLSEQTEEPFTRFFYEAQAQGRSVAGATAKARRVSARATASSPEGAAAVLYLNALGA